MWIPAASNFITLITSRLIRQMLATFLELNSKVVVLCLPSSTKREMKHFHFVVVQRRIRKKTKSVMHVQSCCFANLGPLLFAILVAVTVVVA